MSPSRKTILVVMFEAFSHSWENEDTLGGVLYQECRKGRELKKMEKHICSLQSSCLPTTYNYISYLQPEQTKTMTNDFPKYHESSRSNSSWFTVGTTPKVSFYASHVVRSLWPVDWSLTWAPSPPTSERALWSTGGNGNDSSMQHERGIGYDRIMLSWCNAISSSSHSFYNSVYSLVTTIHDS